VGPTVFAGLRPADPPAESLAGRLHAIADAEDRNAEAEQSRIAAGGIILINAGRPAGEDDPTGGNLSDPLGSDVVPDDLAVDMLLADPTGDELSVL